MYSISCRLNLPMQIRVIASRHSGINAIVDGIDLINEIFSIAQQKTLDIAEAAILYNHHQFTCKI